jgi:hypothetical protein
MRKRVFLFLIVLQFSLSASTTPQQPPINHDLLSEFVDSQSTQKIQKIFSFVSDLPYHWATLFRK